MKRLILIATVICIAILGGYLFFIQKDRVTNSNTSTQETAIEENKIPVDLDGDGQKEYVVLEMPDNPAGFFLKSIKAYDKTGKEIARLPPGITIRVPIQDSAKVYQLDTSKANEVFRLDFVAGPHQSETLFLGLNQNGIFPICFKAAPKELEDCLFYAGNIGDLLVQDLDGDGYIEVIEIVDEYPIEAKLDTKIETIIEEVFEKQGVSEFTEGMKRIARREKGGRGRSVVWAIFSYNGQYFVPQQGSDYDKYYALIGDLIDNKMKKTDLSQDSIEYIEFARNFWTGKERE